MKKQILLKLAILIAVPLVIAAIYTLKPKETPKPESKVNPSEVLAENTQPTVVDDTIVPTVTSLPTQTPTPTVVQTAKPTPIVTKTVAPTPTEYLRHAIPANSTEEMENKICKLYGEKDCYIVIKWAQAENVKLSPSFQVSTRNSLGVLSLDCTYGTRKLMGKDAMSDEEFLTYCRSVIFDAETNIRIPLELYKTKGIDALTEYLRFGIVR